MQIGVIGAGLIGSKLGRLLARAGHGVAFSYSRSPGKLDQLARQAGDNARAATSRPSRPLPVRFCSRYSKRGTRSSGSRRHHFEETLHKVFSVWRFFFPACLPKVRNIDQGTTEFLT